MLCTGTPQWLIDEINRLASAENAEDFKLMADSKSLPREEQRIARALKRALVNCKAIAYTGVKRQELLEERLLRREEMLKCLNRAAEALLAKKGATFEKSMSEGMKHISDIAKIDRASIFQNTEKPDGLYTSQVFRWSKRAGRAIALRPEFIDKPYEECFPRWREVLAANGYVNGPVHLMPEADILLAVGCLSVLAIPVFHDRRFWGFILFENLTEEQEFNSDEIGILNSASFLLANAMMRNEETQQTRAASEYAALLLDTTPLCCRLWDRNYNLLACNEAAVQMFGLKSKQEYIERYFELAPEVQPDGQPTRERVIEVVDAAFQDGICRDRMYYRMPDGSPLPAENTLVRIPYGEDYVVASYSHDLREQEKILEELGTRDRLLQTVNYAADILLQTEPEVFEDTMQMCMGMMAHVFGADRMRVIKNTVCDGLFYRSLLYEWSEGVPPMKGTVFTSAVSYLETTPALLKTMLHRGYVHSCVRDMPVSDQKWFQDQGVLAILMIPVFSGDTFWGMVGFDNCHSEQLFTEVYVSLMQSGGMIVANALLRSETILDLRETSAQLKTALSDANDANSAKDDFLATMSHEIRTPLNAVVGLAELAMDSNMPMARMEETLEKIYTSGMTILSIVNDMLDISKIVTGRFELYPARYDTPSLIHDVVVTNSVRIGDKPISFKLAVDESLPEELFGDDLRVKQVFNNLISNALKYTSAGTVEWRIGCERDGDSDWIVSEIQDTGIGIRQENLPKLFGDYYQADRRANRQIEGTGLGLAITKRFVELMDGCITVQSKFGEGSTFFVRLRQGIATEKPIGKSVAKSLMNMQYSRSKRDKTAKMARVNLSYAHVLVVDDIKTNLDVIKGLLLQYGLKVDCAFDGRQAVAMIKAGSPRYSAVFMDHMMPEMDGVEALKIIRGEIGTKYAQNLPVIVLTANAVTGNKELFLEHGFQAFLSKPIDVVKLDAILRHWVRDKSREREMSALADIKADDGSGAFLPDDLAIEGINLPWLFKSMGGNRAELLNVLRSYVAETKLLLRDMGSCLVGKNMARYSVAAHGLKGASHIISATDIGERAGALELFAAKENFKAVHAQHPVFAQVAQTLLENIEAVISRLSTDVRPVADAPDPALLCRLCDACADFDMSGVDAVMEQLEAFQYESGDELVAWLREKVNSIAYEEISTRITSEILTK